MPYIEDKKRIEAGGLPNNAGELSYTLAVIVVNYLREKGESYQVYSDVIGSLESLKLEIYRRLVANYEDKKIKENGDVFT